MFQSCGKTVVWITYTCKTWSRCGLEMRVRGVAFENASSRITHRTSIALSPRSCSNSVRAYSRYVVRFWVANPQHVSDFSCWGHSTWSTDGRGGLGLGQWHAVDQTLNHTTSALISNSKRYACPSAAPNAGIIHVFLAMILCKSAILLSVFLFEAAYSMAEQGPSLQV